MVTMLIFGKQGNSDNERKLFIDDRPNAAELAQADLGKGWFLLEERQFTGITQIKISNTLANTASW